MKEKNVLTKLPAGEIVEIKKLADGTFEVTQKVLVEECGISKQSHSISKSVVLDTRFVQIEAESLSLDDEFMKYQPPTNRGAWIKEFIAEAINFRVKNFYRPIMDPSFTEGGIEYVAGKMPAVGKSYNWWFDIAKEYNPYLNSRLGTRLEYGAFLGVLIKKLVEEGYPVGLAWASVCNDSKELGHYCNSAIAECILEPTGSRCVCGFYDLANTYKILAEDIEEGGYWLAGGGYNLNSYDGAIAVLYHCESRLNINLGGVGWIVLS